jgi:hypothetical protein
MIVVPLIDCGRRIDEMFFAGFKSPSIPDRKGTD